MKLEIQVDTELLQKLDTWTNTTLPQKRQQLVQDALRTTLDETITGTPVDTGRTKAAWEAARETLEANAFNQASLGTTQFEGSSSSQQDEDTTTASATNNVPYISYLEYGTKSMSPFAAVRNALLSIRNQLQNYFHL